MVKQENLSVKELLEQTIVKDEDKPYEVPENWIWSRIGYICEINPKREMDLKEYDDKTLCTFIPMSAVDGELGQVITPEIKKFGEVKKGYTNFKNEDIIFAKITPCMENMKSAIVNDIVNSIGFGSTEFHVIRVNKTYSNNKYMFYFLRSHDFLTEAKYAMTGAVGQQRVSKNFISVYKIPIPPLSEQQRIVAFIESLFEKLDRAKELVQNALDSFENRKSAILHKAFTGELTAKWRKENGVDFEKDWVSTKLGEISALITKGASPKWQGINYVNDGNGVLFVTSENVRQGFLDFSNEKYLEVEINNKQKRSVLKRGDVLVNIVGASIGRAAIFDLDKVANINQAVCLIRLDDKNSIRYLCYYLNSPEALKYYSESKVDVARANLSLQDINNIYLPIPTLEEQQEIVRILDSLLDKEQRAKELCDIIESIDHMKKSILARALRGELGTNNPQEESALELLKGILRER